LLFWSLSAWEVLAALQGAVTTYWLLRTDRFLLGVGEAVMLPAMRNWSVKPPAEPIE
jgi:hypothetical protein